MQNLNDGAYNFLRIFLNIYIKTPFLCRLIISQINKLVNYMKKNDFLMYMKNLKTLDKFIENHAFIGDKNE